MNIIWLGHSGFRIEIADQVLLVDPWLSGNPVFAEDRRDEAIAGATHILLTHGHFDHASDAPDIAAELGIPILAIPELAELVEATDGVKAMDFNKGGTISLEEVSVTMVNACHSSSFKTGDGMVYAGKEAGFMIHGEGHVIYVSGDTDIMADMAWMGAYYQPDIGILACGGHYTMDMKAAAWAAKKYFDFKTVIPCHYRTFPLLAQSAKVLADALPGIDVIEPQVMQPITL
ncbi:MAG TPA: metal-dependent hydrolase [Aliiroseovarius sp.]|nr:metal-dependent hydrolase [Aliiroseovarius sp.]